MNFIEQLIPKEIVTALGWTIFHSIWQGILVSLFLAAILSFINKNSSKIRSIFSTASLLLMLGLFCITFGIELNNSTSLPLQSKVSKLNISSSQQLVINNNSIEELNSSNPIVQSFHDFYNFFNSRLPLIFTLWLIGVILFSIRFTGGLLYIKRIKYHGTNFVSSPWQSKLSSLCSRLKINKSVLLLESVRVKIPMVIGYIKPIVLLPVGTINGMSSEQVETILIHELAHIYRNDYLINILQTVVETIFFYHPAIWWISSIVRKEREKHCDDITVELCGNTITYVKALTNLQESLMENPKYALSLFKRKKNLLERIKRIIAPEETKTALPERMGGFIIVAVILFSTFLYSNTNWKKSQKSIFIQDTIKVKSKVENKLPVRSAKSIFHMPKPASELKNSTDVKVAEKTPAAPVLPNLNTLPPVEPVIPNLNKKPPAEPAPIEFKNMNAKLPPPPVLLTIDSIDSTIPKIIKIKEDTLSAVSDSNEKIIDIVREIKSKNKDLKNQEKKLKKIEEEFNIKEDTLRNINEKKLNKRQNDIERNKKEIKENEKNVRNKEIIIKEKTDTVRQHEELIRKKNLELVNLLRNELVKDGLLKSKGSNLNFDLSKDTLMVNGKIQNKELLDKYKKLVGQKTGDKFSGNNHFKVELKKSF